MPEIKNTFLKGKMNKGLDDRLVPSGEYRDALNVDVTKAEGQDVGALHNVKGNTIAHTSLGLSSDYDLIGYYFDDQNNNIYYFVTNKDNAEDTAADHRIYRWSKDTGNTEVLLSGSFLNFDKEHRITGVNIIEDYLFWTDDKNQPRKINITAEAPTYTAEHQISVAKYAPTYPPTITATVQTQSNIDDDGEIEAGTYMKEKFMRFSYRYKYTDNTYSVLAPFSSFVFSPVDIINRPNQPDLALSQSEIESLMGSTEMTWFENKVNRVLIECPVTGSGPTFGSQGIKSIDIIAKSSDSPAAYILDVVDVSDQPSGTSITYKYLGSNPKSTLPEAQLTRVYDKVPIKAKSQEFVGNRVVYGNYVENLPLPDNFAIKSNVVLRSEISNDNRIFPSYSLKFNRTYDVGYILCDDYGRTSPVLSFLNNRVYNEFPSNADTGEPQFNRKKISIKVDAANKSDAMLQISDLLNLGWKYLIPVVKQDRQEYYNIYTPGFGYINGKSYFSVFGDNINKIPIDTSTFNIETGINTTKQKVYLALENKTTFIRSSSGTEPITVEAQEYYWENYNRADGGSYSPQYIYGFTNVVGYSTGNITQTFNGFTYNTDADGNSFSSAITPATDGTTATFTINGGTVPSPEAPNGTANDTYYGVGASASDNTGVIVYVNGVKKQSVTEYTYNSSNATITFLAGHIPASGDSIVVFFTYGDFLIPDEQNRSAWSLSTITGSASVIETVPGNEVNVVITGSDYIDVTTINETPLRDHDLINLTEIKINGISTRANFKNLADDSNVFDISEDLYGLYKIENNYLLAEIDGEYGVKLYDDSGEFPTSKYADLGILETPGFESSIDIYYETPTVIPLYNFYQALQYSQSFDVYYDVEYYNAITLSITRYINNTLTKWQWQENRLRGGFNEPYIDYGVHAYFTNPDYAQERRQASLIYSGIYNARTGVNNTNQFPIGENIEKSLDPVHGSIQRLFAEDNNLLVFQEEKINRIPIDKDIIYSAEGTPSLAKANVVFGDTIAFAGNYGIGKNPESFAHFAGRKYFVDKQKGAVIRLSADGITEISNYGLRSYFRDNLSNASLVLGMWDMYNKNFILTIKGSEDITIAYDESNNGWTSRFSFIPLGGGSLDGTFYTFSPYIESVSAPCDIYSHYSNNTYNNFYNQQYISEVTLLLNEGASTSKNFQTINYEGSEGWEVTDITTDSDFAKDINKYNVLLQDSDTMFYLSKFDKIEGKYTSNLLNATPENINEVTFNESISGIKGFYAKLTAKTSDNNYKEIFSISSNYNINSY